VRRDGNWRGYFDCNISSWESSRDALAKALEPGAWEVVEEAVRVSRATAQSVALRYDPDAAAGPVIPLGRDAVQALAGIVERVRPG
jgi:hypothetical protein